MKTRICFIVAALLVWTSPTFAQLDLEQEVLVIPDTHDEKPHVWNVIRKPRGYELLMEQEEGGAPGFVFNFSIGPKRPENTEDIHVFVTDEDLHAYEHIRPDRAADGRYSFRFGAPHTGKYRFEIVFRTEKGWVNLKKDLKLRADGKGANKALKPGDEEYAVKLKLIPKKSYAEHVTTFLYEIFYKGEPLKGLERIDGFDMQVVAWDEDLKEFIFALPRQNLGGPEVAVSLVFMRPGRHAVFAEFKHNGEIRRVETVLSVHEEPRHDPNAIENLSPSD